MTELQDMYHKSLHMRTSMKTYAIGNISIPNSLIGQERRMAECSLRPT
jgi:hypothetical protein